MSIFEQICDKQTVAKDDAIMALKDRFGRFPDSIRFIGDSIVYTWGFLDFTFFEYLIDRCPCLKLIECKNTGNGKYLTDPKEIR